MANHNSSNTERAFLGIKSKKVSFKKAQKLGFQNPHGVYVTEVIANTAADFAGVQPFDYIYAVDEFELTDNQSLIKVLGYFEPDDYADLYFIRKGKEESVRIQFTKYRSALGLVGFSKKAYLGVQKRKSSENGIEVGVVRNSPAQEMGLRDYDIITKIDGIKMIDWSDLVLMMKVKSPDDEIEIEVLRDEEYVILRGDLTSNFDRNLSQFERNEAKIEDKYERLEERIEVWGENIEEDVENLAEEIEEGVERYFERRKRKSSRKNDYPQNDELLAKSGEQPIVKPFESEEVQFFETLSEYANAPTLTVENLNFEFVPQTEDHLLNFYLPESGDTKIQIFNMNGRLVYDYEMGQFSGQFDDKVELDSIRNQSYFLIIKQDERVVTRKIDL